MARSDTARGSPEPGAARLVGLGPAERHREVARGFAAIADDVTDWGAPAPVPGWSARDVVGHLVDWSTDVLATGGVELETRTAVGDDPAVAWAAHTTAVQALLDDADRAAMSFQHPMLPPRTLSDTLDAIYTSDVFLHTWDLGRAAGLAVRLDPGFCEELLAGMVPMEQLLRDSGQYGAPVPVPADADPQTRLLGFIGRDPR